MKVELAIGVGLAIASLAGVGLTGCGGCKKSKDSRALEEALAARVLALEANRLGDAEEAIQSYIRAEKILQTIVSSNPNSSLAKDAQSYLEACEVQRRAAESPQGVIEALLVYMPKSNEVEWDILVDFPRVAKEVIGEQAWDGLSDARKASMVGLLKDGGIDFFGGEGNIFNVAKHNVHEGKIDGTEAVVPVTTQFAMKEVDSVCRLVQVGTVWKFYDAYCETLNAGFAQFIRETLDLVQTERTLEDLLDRREAKEIFSGKWIEVTRGAGQRFDQSYQGQTVRVTAPEGAKIVSGDTALGTAPAGTHFKVIQERDTDTGAWLLMNFDSEGTSQLGWVEKRLVEPIAEAEIK